jgi:hypothetical protein
MCCCTVAAQGFRHFPRVFVLAVCFYLQTTRFLLVGLPGLEPGTSSLSETIAYVVNVYCCSKIPANLYFSFSSHSVCSLLFMGVVVKLSSDARLAPCDTAGTNT